MVAKTTHVIIFVTHKCGQSLAIAVTNLVFVRLSVYKCPHKKEVEGFATAQESNEMTETRCYRVASEDKGRALN